MMKSTEEVAVNVERFKMRMKNKSTQIRNFPLSEQKNVLTQNILLSHFLATALLFFLD